MQASLNKIGTATGSVWRRLTQRFLTYSISAAANATAAGLYASAVGLQQSGNPLTGLANIAGTLAIYAGLLAGLASAVLFIAALEDLRIKWHWIDPDLNRVFSIFRTLGLFGLVALGLIAVVYLGSSMAFTFERAQLIAVAFQAVCGVAAAIFTIALAWLPFTLSAERLRRLPVVAVFLAGVRNPRGTGTGVMNFAPFGPARFSLGTVGGFFSCVLDFPIRGLFTVSAAVVVCGA